MEKGGGAPSRRALLPFPAALCFSSTPYVYIQSRHATMNSTNYVAFSFAALFDRPSARARVFVARHCSRCQKRGTSVRLRGPEKIGKLEGTDEEGITSAARYIVYCVKGKIGKIRKEIYRRVLCVLCARKTFRPLSSQSQKRRYKEW